MQQSYNSLIESYKQITVAESALQQALENFKIEQDNFDAGVITASDLLEAQVLAQQSKDQLTEAKTIYMIRRAEYLNETAQN